jgi:hypothetical protein
MRRQTQLLLVLVCCAVFSACKTPETSAAGSVGAAACRNQCDEVYNKCSAGCHVDDTICPEACVDAMASCNKRCG